MINIKSLARLARLKLTPKEEKAFSKDLEKIVNYFDNLRNVDVAKVEVSGTNNHSLKNILRDDQVDPVKKAQSTNETGLVIQSFPKEEKGYLKVPKIF